ncbi:hypothetical protein HDU93_002531 [Gonapodya sp. JEL0774]|nr:hypothetical protein HDU93_002531 [Gonapodya sp. JEL0774]
MTSISSNIKIAVRVRPLNTREKERGARCCVQMNGAQTSATDPESGKTTTFAFDYSYWSSDGAVERNGELVPQSSDSPYADQKRVFEELGAQMVDAAAEGYNSTLMAYGQTGSGKSYTMFGYGANKGLIPLLCEDIFRRFGAGDERKEYHISMSFCEIYNERVKDLLSDDLAPLKVRQSQAIGFYVEGLKELPVENYSQVEHLVDRGTKNRSVAATKMNETSSRAHTIITLKVQQSDRETKAEKMSTLHLVDLAGSERVADTGLDQKGRLREAGNINSSLSVLGTVIAALVQQQQGKKNVIVPYRDSVLTKLLQNALGGNSKTIMVGAISPANIHYDETVSTLRFLDRAKAIKTVAIVNENPTDRLIRELREENEKLKAMLAERERLTGSSPTGTTNSNGSKSVSPADQKVLANLQAQIAEKEKDIRKLEEVNKTWEQRLEEAQVEFESRKSDDDILEERKLAVPNLKNVNEDPLLSGMLFYFIETGKHLVGRVAKGTKADIQLNGLSILPEHAILTNTGNTKLTIKPCSSMARVRVNGLLLNDCENPVALRHNDRVLIGAQHLYIVKFPHVPDDPEKEPTWSDAQSEIAQGQGFGRTGNSGALRVLSDYIVEFLPLVNDANAIAEDLHKSKRFELSILGDEGIAGSNTSPPDEDLKGQTLDVVIRVTDTENGFKWLWSKEHYYQLLLDEESGSRSPLSQSDDPFDFAPEDYIIGIASFPILNLLTIRAVEPSIIIRDYKGSNEGILKASLGLFGKGLPPPKESSFTDVGRIDSVGEELLGKSFTVRVKIENILGLRWTRGGIKCRFKLPINDPLICKLGGDALSHQNSRSTQLTKLFRTLLTSSTLETNHYYTTRTLPSSANPQFDDIFESAVKKLTVEQLEYLRSGDLFIEVWGDHSAAAREPTAATSRSRIGTSGVTPREGTPAQRTRGVTNDSFIDITAKDGSTDVSQMKAELLLKSRLVADLTAKNFNLNSTIVSLNSEIGHLRQELVTSKRDVVRLRQSALPPQSLFACFTSDGRSISVLRQEIIELEKAKSSVEAELARLRSDTSFLIAKDEVLARLDALAKVVRDLQAPLSPVNQFSIGLKSRSPAQANGLAATPEESDPLEIETDNIRTTGSDVALSRTGKKRPSRTNKVTPAF